jgi:type III secretion system YscJ/HrcJ family lipoprotein
MITLRLGKVLLCGLTLLALTACNREIVRSQLTEDQANEISVALFSAKIAPVKSIGEKSADNKLAAWQVAVPKEDYAFALAIIQQYGLPRTQYQSAMCQQFKKDGMVSSGVEDRGRDMCAKSHDLETALRSIDGVVWPTVRVSIPGRDPLAEKSDKPSVSVTVKHTPQARIEVDKIRQMVRDSVSGVPLDNVSVAITELQPLLRANYQPEASSGQSILATLSLVLGVLGVVAVAAGAIVWFRRRRAVISLPSTIVHSMGTMK